MSILSLEHGRAAYRADFVLYGTVVVLLAVALGLRAPAGHLLGSAATVAAGLAGWTLLEYALHRFVLHGIAPFSEWHAQHHRRPQALIGLPTLASATLFATLVFLPAYLLFGRWHATALLLGMLLGYLAYAAMHHMVHHGPAQAGWLQRRRRWHALHHRGLGTPGARTVYGAYGVTSAFWDRRFGTAPAVKAGQA
jgi:cyclopropane-fatty-acyl-phospholipid synthase